MPESDLGRDLLKAQAGNLEALGRVLAHCEERLKAFLHTIVPRDEVDDVLQDTYLGICTGLRQLMSNHKFRAWTYQVAYHKALDWHRRHRKQLEFDSQAFSNHDQAISPPKPEGLTQEQRAQIQNALDALPQGLKETCWLFYGEGLSVDDTAAVLEIPVGTAKWRLHEGRKRLCEHLGELS